MSSASPQGSCLFSFNFIFMIDLNPYMCPNPDVGGNKMIRVYFGEKISGKKCSSINLEKKTVMTTQL